MRRSRFEETLDLTARLQQVEELVAQRAPAPREPLHDTIAPLARWLSGDVARCGGRIYVLHPRRGPRFQTATWLGPARRVHG